MNACHRSIRLLAFTLGAVLLAVPATAAEQRQGEPVQLELYTTDLAPERVQAVGEALGFNDWPRSAGLFVAPPIASTLLPGAEALGRAVRACTAVRFAGEPWGHCEWSWSSRTEAGEVEEGGRGRLQLAITLAPDARAAQEYLLAGLTDNMMPTEGVVGTLRSAKRPEGLGDISFEIESRSGGDTRLYFTRANLAVRIRGDGALSGAALELARRIDARVLDQRPLSPEQLLERRPTIELGGQVEDGALAYEVRVPGRGAGQGQVVAVRAWVGGRAVPAQEGRVEMGGEGAEAGPVEVVVVTAELLAGEARREGPGGG